MSWLWKLLNANLEKYCSLTNRKERNGRGLKLKRRFNTTMRWPEGAQDDVIGWVPIITKHSNDRGCGR